MALDSATTHDDLKEILDGRFFDLLYANNMNAVMLVDVTETGEGYPKILRVNPGFTRSMGYLPEEVVGGSTEKLLPEDADRSAVEVFRARARRLEPARGDLLVRTKTGETRWVESVTTPIAVGDRIICLLVHRDISQRKEIEARLNERTALLEQAERLGQIGHWTWDIETNRVFWSDEIYRIHGLGHTDEKWRGDPIDYYHDEDRAHFKRCLGEAKRIGKDFEFVLRVVRPEGQIRYVDTKGYCKRGPDGTVQEIFGVFQDITDISTAQAVAESERNRFQDALESISAGVLVLDRDDRLVIMNRHYEEAFPELKGAAKPGMAFADILRLTTSSHRPMFGGMDDDERFALRMERHRRAEGVEAFQTEDGRWFRVEEHRMSDGGMILIRLDITTQMQAQQALLEAKETAEFASRSKSDFLANMSHELRTPLNAIIGFGELLKLNLSGDLTETSLQYARDIVDSGEHLLAIINDILDLSKIEGGTILLEKGFEDVGTLIDSTVPLLRQTAASNETKISVEVPDGLPRLYCDGLRIKQVILNLLSNAVKFTPGGSVVTRAAVAGDRLRIEIVDTGIGMQPEDLKLALLPFGQIDENHMTRKYEGTGLGLPLAKRLTELHGGAFSIDSAVGEGTTVCLEFPLTPQDADMTAPSRP